MIRSSFFLLVSSIFLLACSQETKVPDPPVAKKIAKEFEAHGDIRVDNYYWMRLTDAQKGADSADAQTRDVLDYLEAENTYSQEIMAPTSALQDSLYEEIVGRMEQDDSSVPVTINGYSYYTRYEEGNQYPLYCRKALKEDAVEEILLNGPEMAQGKAYFAVGQRSVSEDNEMLAFGVDTVSRRQYTLHFKDLKSGEILDERIDNVQSVAWANDNKTLFYSRKDPVTLRSFQVYRHQIGTDPDQDALVYEESDPTFQCYVTKSKSRDYLFLVSSHSEWTEYRYLESDAPEATWTVFHPREKGINYYVDHVEDSFLIRTNYQAKNYRLMKCTGQDTEVGAWQEVIPYNPEVRLENVTHFRDYSVLQERIDGLVQLHVLNREDLEDYYIEFNDPTYLVWIYNNPESDTEIFRYIYSSFTTPVTVYDLNLSTRERKLRKQDKVLGGDFSPDNYKSERIMATGRDGTEIPVSLVYRKDTEVNAETPLLLYGYGSYGANMNASFDHARLSLLDRGFVYAIAHIRGGQEMGRDWYDNGKLLRKKNTFYDFIDCGKHLVTKGYTSPDHLYALGGSAGGLLMGAVVNMEPELFNGVIAAVPFVDVISTMLDESIPLTTYEFDEWGNPKDKEYYDYMLSYSPYDNVQKMEYPNLLVTTGYWDSQVQYWEPAKWVAKLREYKTDDNLLLLDTNMDVGHGGASGRFERYRRTALMYAFLLNLEEKPQ
jgi:oligopeptidase B